MKLHKQLAWIFMASLFMGGVGCSSQPENTVENFVSAEDRTSNSIINGINVAPSHPLARSVVGIYNDQTKTICTGSLLANNMILTAAHCAITDPRFLYIVFELDFSSSAPARVSQYKIRQVVAAVTSPVWKYQEQFLKNQGDIGLLKFNGSVPYGYIPATFLTDYSVLKKGVPIVIAGYGISTILNMNNPSTGRTLRQTTVALLDPQFSELEMLVDQTKGRGACFGDSGGPAYVFINGRYYLWGIINRGYNLAEKRTASPSPQSGTSPSKQRNNNSEDHCDKQAIYAKINNFSSWIDLTTKALAQAR